MAVLKILVSAALLGTVARCQDLYSPYLRSGTSAAQYAPSVVSRGTPRLVPVKVRASASRFFPSFYYPAHPPPPIPSMYARHQALSHRPYSSPSSPSTTPTKSLQYQQPTFPRHQYRPAMTGYYRPVRQSFYTNPFRESGQNVGFHTSATSAPIVLKRGRLLASPYNLATSSAGSLSAAGLQYNSPGLSAYRSPQYQTQYQPQAQYQPQTQYQPQAQYQPQQQYQSQAQQQQQQQSQPQISSAPAQYSTSPQSFIQAHVQQPQYQQPTYYAQKAPVLVGPAGRPLKKLKKVSPRPTAAAAEEEEEYPSDPNPQYNFSFDIKDDELTNYQNRQEERDGQTIKGSYSVVDPDGYVRTVTYTADPKNGFQAKVTREPTDVKIKFPVPTEAPEKAAGPARRGQAYATAPQAQYQPQYQQAAYATPQQVYTSTAGEAGVVHQPQAQPQYVQRTASRFAIQPQATVAQPRITSRPRVQQQ